MITLRYGPATPLPCHAETSEVAPDATWSVDAEMADDERFLPVVPAIYEFGRAFRNLQIHPPGKLCLR
jgi:hypothetical protein